MCQNSMVRGRAYQKVLNSAKDSLEQRMATALDSMLNKSRFNREVSLDELGVGGCILLTVIYALATGDVHLCSALLELAMYHDPFQSEHFFDWLMEDYRLNEELLQRALLNANWLKRYNVLNVPEHIHGIVSKLATELGIDSSLLLDNGELNVFDLHKVATKKPAASTQTDSNAAYTSCPTSDKTTVIPKVESDVLCSLNATSEIIGVTTQTDSNAIYPSCSTSDKTTIIPKVESDVLCSLNATSERIAVSTQTDSNAACPSCSISDKTAIIPKVESDFLCSLNATSKKIAVATQTDLNATYPSCSTSDKTTVIPKVESDALCPLNATSEIIAVKTQTDSNPAYAYSSTTDKTTIIAKVKSNTFNSHNPVSGKRALTIQSESNTNNAVSEEKSTTTKESTESGRPQKKKVRERLRDEAEEERSPKRRQKEGCRTEPPSPVKERNLKRKLRQRKVMAPNPEMMARARNNMREQEISKWEVELDMDYQRKKAEAQMTKRERELTDRERRLVRERTRIRVQKHRMKKKIAETS